MSVLVIPVQLNIEIDKTGVDAGGTSMYTKRREEADIAADLQEQLNADIPEEAQLITLIPSSKRTEKYLAIFHIPHDATMSLDAYLKMVGGTTVTTGEEENDGS